MDGFGIIEYDSVGSTNAEAKSYAARCDGYSPMLFIAREQSAGRGRLGKSFLSRRGRGIYMSVLYFTDAAMSDAVSITGAAAVVVASAIEGAVGREMKIKWVNDVYNEKGKVAGILVETLSVGDRLAVIVGVGINTGEDNFPEELAGIASSIGEVSEEQRRDLILSIARGILRHADGGHVNGYIDEYRRRSMLDGERVELFSAGESVGTGRVEGIDDDGGLIVLFDGENEPRVVRSGEVSVRRR